MLFSLLTVSMLAGGFRGELNADDICRIASENGIQCLDLMDVEIRHYGAEALERAMKAYGIHCDCVIACATFYTHPEAVEMEIKNDLELAKRFCAHYLMVVPGEHQEEELQVTAKMSRQQMLDVAIEKFSIAVELAKPFGICVGFENTPHANKPLSAGRDCLYVLEHVHGLGLFFDFANFRVADTSNDETETYEQLKKYIVRVHVKDVIIGHFPNGELCCDGQKILAVETGTGVIDVDILLKKLRLDGYKGAFVIEYAQRQGVKGLENSRCLKKYVDYIHSVLKT